MKESTWQIWKAWIPAIIWLGIITFESTSYLSSDNTSRFLYPLVHFLFGMEPARFAVFHHYLRKTGHFVGYFTLSCLLFRAWRATLPAGARLIVAKRWTLRWGVVSYLMTTLIASLDEWHQTFIPSRTGTVHDVVLDSSAALTAQFVIFRLLRDSEFLRSTPVRNDTS